MKREILVYGFPRLSMGTIQKYRKHTAIFLPRRTRNNRR